MRAGEASPHRPSLPIAKAEARPWRRGPRVSILQVEYLSGCYSVVLCVRMLAAEQGG